MEFDVEFNESNQQMNVDFSDARNIGTTDHSELENRDSADQHPISAITGLGDALATKGTYSKPSGGIPDSDLSSGVNASLEKADSAVQPAAIVTSAPQTLADNTIYNLSDVTTLALVYPSGAFDCIINLSTAASGTVTITFPTSIYQPSVPTFGNGETWTLWIRNNPLTSGGIVTAQKAVAS